MRIAHNMGPGAEVNERAALPCGCKRGQFLCREAELLWRYYFKTRGQQELQDYEDHFANVTT